MNKIFFIIPLLLFSSCSTYSLKDIRSLETLVKFESNQNSHETTKMLYEKMNDCYQRRQTVTLNTTIIYLNLASNLIQIHEGVFGYFNNET